MSGMNSDRLARIEPFLQEQYVGAGKLPMADILIARGGETVYRATLGQARADGTPLRHDAIYRIASMTKPITSIAFMQLVEEGKVALDDPVARVIPEFANLGVYSGGGGTAPFAPVKHCAPMRMVDLMSHMSGLTYGFQNRTSIDAAYRKTLPDGDRSMDGFDWFIAELARLPLEFAPGTGWNYSVATDVLGVVISRIENKPLGEVLRERIFAPLGMFDTGFQIPEHQRARLTDCWAYAPGKPLKLIDRATESNLATPARFEGGGSGLVSTTADYHRFCQMLIGRGVLDGVRIISPKTLDLMTRNHLPGGSDLAVVSQSLFSEAGNSGTGFGLGFAMTLDPVRALIPGSEGEYFWGGMYSTAFFVDPVERLHMVFMTQLAPSSDPIRRQLKTLIYSAIEQSYA
ncbi:MULTISPECIES: serine hydrolase domain-containing protein [Pseudomonas]|uniref:Beta-lactamase family protein n=1 Tax=Pseudomonas petroselini TaxID=2899822 RepID=A0ABS8QPU4_9PSED|nr:MULTISPECIES: serine hydrolase domain-containing protein [Pseudomonas]MCD7037685.1 beta-lactamase family protein [Pseudomonas petroselini]MCD7046948.1 beta-lactamase family protein [Pseudomonas petroselini]MCD7066506.1 beta-lactamase family protein [Pseudomonas petroselini]MCD7080273.1 beta-lactamase family protein [Pseudomonas petroselini]MCM2380447.1 beta-lactamase family protein [Pseudomonas marginalis]